VNSCFQEDNILSWINEAKKPREYPISDEGLDHPVSDEESDHTGEVVSRTMCHIEPEVSGGETSLVSTSTEGTRTTSTDAERCNLIKGNLGTESTKVILMS